MEDAYLVPAILWLLQTILGTLGIRELDSWIRQAGLQGLIENLRSELEVLQALASDAKEVARPSARLDKSLADLKRFLYDADDLVDELDYWRLRQQVEGGQHALPSSSNDAYNHYASDGVTQNTTMTTPVTLQEPDGMHEAAQVDHGTLRGHDNIPGTSTRGKKRSKAWDDFVDIKDGNGKTVQAECRHCKRRVQYKGAQGPRVLTTHVNSAYCKNTREAHPQPPSHSSIDAAAQNATPVAVFNSSSTPMMGTNQEPIQTTAATAHPWNKDEFSSRMREITRQLHDIREDVTMNINMLGFDSGASSSHHQSTASDPSRRTSSLLQGKVYGRDEEKDSIINRMTAGKSDSVTVLPIVGIGGTGKTALAQFVYNDPNVQNQFDQCIWVWVSNNLDEMIITREMLDIVPPEKHEGLCSLDKLQQVLKTHIESKRVLLILDDVWDDMNDGRMDVILAPFKSDNAKGNVILVTTRYLSVAKRIGTTEPVVLGALKDEDLWSLFKARAFRDEKYEGHGNLTNIGWKIASKLKGNPLAAVTAGELLRVDLTVGHWNKILKDEDGKLLGRSGRIMSSLKLSYDQLPYHLHQCFSYCSIFSDYDEFLAEELVHIWISQGFVTRTHSSKRLEDIGMDYLADLVNLGYFQQVESKDSPLGSQNSYVVSGLMHDFARMVSRAECGIVDGLQCNDMLPTVQHLAVVYRKDQHRNMSCTSKFEDDLRNAVTSVRKLRTLLLIGQYDCSFFQSFKDIFQKARDIRLLQISATFADFNSLACSSINPTHLRYLTLTVNEVQGDLPQVFRNFCHLQVLDVGSNTDLNVPYGMNNLVSLRHLVAAPIARIGTLTSLQKLSNFSIQDSDGFQIIELQSMNDLVQLGISQLQNVKTREEAHRAGLQDKWHLEKLYLSWKDIMPYVEYDLDDSDEYLSSMPYEPSTIIEIECLLTEVHVGPESSSSGVEMEERLLTQVHEIPEACTSTEMEEHSPAEVLEGLRPYKNLKHLRISEYTGATSPSWLASNAPVTSLQTLHLENCGEWQILPSLEGLPFLANLSLSNMPKVKEVSIPSLEELVLIKMPKLERCSCISLNDLNSCLRALIIQNCPALKVFDLFGNGHKFKIEQNSWLPRLCELTLKNCHILVVPHPLPSSSTACRISMSRVPKFPRIEVSSSGSLTIGEDFDDYDYDYDVPFDKLSDELFVLDGNVLAFHNLRFLTQLIICGCRKLTSISLKGLSQLKSLKTLKITYCPGLSGFDAPSEHALLSLKYLKIASCGIAWEWLSLILQHAPALTELDLWYCPNLESLQLNSCTALEKLHVCTCESLGTLDVFQSRSLRNMELSDVPNLESLQLNSCTALEKLEVYSCESLGTLDVCQSRSLRNMELFNVPKLKSLELNSCTALEKLKVYSCESLGTLDVLQSRSLRNMELFNVPKLKSLELNSCTALEKLKVYSCESLGTLDVLQSRSLRDMEVEHVPKLKSLQLHSCMALEELGIRETAVCVLEGSQSLRKLGLYNNQDLKSLQLHSCVLLEELDIRGCTSLSTLEGFQSLGSLRRLYLRECPGLHSCLEGLPVQTYELCPQLEFLEVSDFSFFATLFCRKLTSLQRLFIRCSMKETKAPGLTDEQERGLLLLGSLTELRFEYYKYLKYLPAGLYRLRSLRVLEISFCPSISRLPDLPPSLEELIIFRCSEELAGQSKSLASSKLKVEIDHQYVH
ncbi:putative disease resistance protein RGA4 [Hordeum vulgare]|nr:putative disease resistance protein RGA4 [Hordeum vulgare]